MNPKQQTPTLQKKKINKKILQKHFQKHFSDQLSNNLEGDHEKLRIEQSRCNFITGDRKLICFKRSERC